MSKNIIWTGTKFIALSAWIVFLALTAQVFYAPDVYEQLSAVDKCLLAAKKDGKDVSMLKYDFVKKDGSGLAVLLAPEGEGIIFCKLNSKHEIEYVF